MDVNIMYTEKLQQISTITFSGHGSTNVRLYRKNETDQYLNYDPKHLLEHNQSVARTLLQRAEHHMEEEEEKITDESAECKWLQTFDE